MLLKKIKIEDRYFWYREKTSDIKALKESYLKGYENKSFIQYEPQDIWLDGGANVGGFSVKIADKVKQVYSFEPDKDNFLVLEQNTKDIQNIELHRLGLGIYERKTILYKNVANGNVWRNSTLKKFRNSTSEFINIISIDEFIKKNNINCLKLDIEGGEFEILEKSNFINISKLIFEYSFDIDSSLIRYRKIIKRLQELGFVLSKATMYEGYDYWQKSWFPPAITVFAKR